MCALNPNYKLADEFSFNKKLNNETDKPTTRTLRSFPKASNSAQAVTWFV